KGRGRQKISSPTPQDFFGKREYAAALDYLNSDYRSKRLQDISAWYINNLHELTEFIRTLPFKNYVKLFFDIEQFPHTSEETDPSQHVSYFEYLLYTIPKIYNSNDYNQFV